MVHSYTTIYTEQHRNLNRAQIYIRKQNTEPLTLLFTVQGSASFVFSTCQAVSQPKMFQILVSYFIYTVQALQFIQLSGRINLFTT